MMKKARVWVALCFSMLTATSAYAQQFEGPFTFSVKPRIGVADVVGAPLEQFTTPAALWGLELAFGTSYALTFELHYFGTIRLYQQAPMPDSVLLLQNGIEGYLRYTLPGFIVSPLFVGGIGWSQFQFLGVDEPPYGARELSDSAITVPSGFGFAVQTGYFTMDLRAVFVPVISENLFIMSLEQAFSMSYWTISLGLGANI
jgi:hypothetical protein